MTNFVASSVFQVPLTLNVADQLTVTRQGSIPTDASTTGAIRGAGGNALSTDGAIVNNSPIGFGVLLDAGANSIMVGQPATIFGGDDGVRVNGAGSNTFTIQGRVTGQAGNGVTVEGSGNTFTLGATSVIIGQFDGITISGGGNSFANIGLVNGITSRGLEIQDSGNIIFNGGMIFGRSQGVLIDGSTSGVNTIVNTGFIGATVDDAIESASAVNLTNSGTIDCTFGVGVQSFVGDQGNTIVNNGFIIGRIGQALNLSDSVASGDTVINNGFLQGQIFAAVLNGGDDLFDGRNGLQFGAVTGGDGNDTLFGGAGADSFVGGSGNDQLLGGAGPDRLDGSTGFDFVRYDLGGAVTVSLENPSVNTGDAAGDATLNIEGVIGSSFADAIIGNGSANTMNGLGGNDALAGGAGTDTLLGGAGADFLFGEADGDLITGGAGGDVIRGGLGGDLFQFNLGDNGDLIQAFNEGGVRDGFDLRGYFNATGFTGTDPRGAGVIAVLQNGADTDVFLHNAFAFRIQGVTAAAIDDSYFLFQ